MADEYIIGTASAVSVVTNQDETYLFLGEMIRATVSSISIGQDPAGTVILLGKDISSTATQLGLSQSLFSHVTHLTGTGASYGNILAHEGILEWLIATASSNGDSIITDFTSFYPEVVTAVYPDVIDTVQGTIPFQWQYEQRALVSNFANGTESRRLSWQATRKNVSINYKYRTRTEAATIYDFYQEMEGQLSEFAFFFPNNSLHTKEYCGTFTGATTTINLPSLLESSTSFKELFINGVKTTAYTFVHKGGPDGGDRLSLNNAPAIGSKIHFSFYGRLKIKARFGESVQVRDIKNRFLSFSVDLVGLEQEFV